LIFACHSNAGPILSPNDFLLDSKLYTFDELIGDVPFPYRLELDSVTITNEPVKDQLKPIHVISDQNLCISGNCLTEGTYDWWRFYFDSPVNGFGIYVTPDNGISSNSYIAMYLNDVLVGSSQIENWGKTRVNGYDRYFAGWESGQLSFNEVQLFSNTPNFRGALDNLYVTKATIPIPATLALFSIGLAGLGWSRRRKA